MKIPILKQGDILTTSIQVELSDQDALDFQNDVLEEALCAEASGIVIDITALDASREDLYEYCLKPAISLRQRVRNQLAYLDPEYKAMTISVEY